MFELSLDGVIATLRLRRPEARNAISLGGWAELAERAEEAVRNDARVLLLAGEPGGAFCSGADLAGFNAFRENLSARTEFRLAIRSGLDRLRALPIPTIAVVEGACFGAGVAVAMACDMRIAGPRAQFAITPAKLGISYPQEDVHRLVGLVGAGQAGRLLFGAQIIDGPEAERIRLVEFVAAAVSEVALHMAEAMARNDPESLRTLKRGIGRAEAGGRVDHEQDRLFDALLGSDALFERLSKHRQRRG
jgi:enoyl-CoA hydratase/carnithine racemase